MREPVIGSAVRVGGYAALHSTGRRLGRVTSVVAYRYGQRRPCVEARGMRSYPEFAAVYPCPAPDAA